MVAALEAFCSLGTLYDEAGIFLTKEEFLEAMNFAERFMVSYDELNKWANEANRKLFHIVHKFHTMQHLVKDSFYLNPRFTWNFRAEDYVGKISKLAHSLSFGLVSTRLSNKIAEKYLVLLHLQLTMPGFGWSEELADP